LSASRKYTVACLAGDGIGPEVMAEASRALAAVSRLHGFAVEEVHVPFGGDAVRRAGHPLPAQTRDACRAADAVLVAATKEPALEGVKADFDLTWRVQRVRSRASEVTIVSPLVDEAAAAAIANAFALARSRGARVTSVGRDEGWRRLVDETAERHAGLEVEHLSLDAVLPLLVHAPSRFDVVVCDRLFDEALSSMAAFADGIHRRVVASGRLAADGKGIFGPTHGSALEIAGQGVANPSGMMLAAGLLLSEGLAERAAGQTLDRAVASALRAGLRTPDMVDAPLQAATTREFVDVLLAELPRQRTDTEFFPPELLRTAGGSGFAPDYEEYDR
jgi:3-isopropylmalate dehydrogenase